MDGSSADKKKKTLPQALIFLLFVTLLLVVALCITGIFQMARPASQPDNPEGAAPLSATVVVDAGHGGMDAGCTGCTGVKEDALNLDVAKKLQQLLRDSGAKVVMTRETHEALADTKDGDMQRRKEIIGSAGADIVVSIHMNSFSDASVSGPQVFYHGTSEKGRELAEAIQASMNARLDPAKPRVHMNGDYFILRAGEAPSVIVECGFLSNAKEEALLKDEAYRRKVAQAVLEGIRAYFGEADAGEEMDQ